jgi:hypothetical protein
MIGYASGPAFSASRMRSPMPLPPPISSAMMSTTSATAAATRSPVAMNGAALGKITVANLRGPRTCSTVAVSRTTGSSDRTP